jgi:hypothetical protein
MLKRRLSSPHCHPFFLKKIDFYYKGVTRGGMRGAYVEGLFLANLLTEIFTRISLRNYYTISLSLSLSLSLPSGMEPLPAYRDTAIA